MTAGGDLTRYDAMCRAIAEARAVDEVVQIRDQARALEAAARVARNRDAEAHVAVIRLRAERRLGQMILDQRATGMLNRGGRPKTGSSADPVSPALPTLAEAGVDKHLADRSRKLAAVPDEAFEEHVQTFETEVRDAGARVSAKLLHEGAKALRREANRRPVAGGGTTRDLEALADSGARFGVIYADPPWTYETWSARGEDRSASQHYDTETTEEIMARGDVIRRLAADDSILDLWCLSSMVPEALQVIEAWGFVFKKVGFIWLKTVADGSAPRMNNGKWTRDEAEICLLATRGSPERLDAGVRQTHAEPSTTHSAKPEEFRKRIERLTAGPYLELYARTAIEGWTCWGNQVEWTAPDPLEIPPGLRRGKIS